MRKGELDAEVKMCDREIKVSLAHSTVNVYDTQLLIPY